MKTMKTVKECYNVVHIIYHILSNSNITLVRRSFKNPTSRSHKDTLLVVFLLCVFKTKALSHQIQQEQKSCHMLMGVMCQSLWFLLTPVSVSPLQTDTSVTNRNGSIRHLLSSRAERNPLCNYSTDLIHTFHPTLKAMYF